MSCGMSGWMGKRGGKLKLAAAALGAVGAVAGSLVATRVKQSRARTCGGHVPYGPYEAVVKRPLDAVIAAGSLVVLSPLLAATTLIVRAKLGSPAIFRQDRPGKDGETFTMYKFRTMTDERDPETGELLPDEVRLTELGKKMRAYSLDELPELVNILRGEMALIGPRPLLIEYLPLYSPEQAHRHDVRPGLTGLAQISGRNAIQWEDKFRHDVEYVNNLTFAMDLRIFVTTFRVIILRKGIHSATSATMEAFAGSEAAEADAPLPGAFTGSGEAQDARSTPVPETGPATIATANAYGETLVDGDAA